MAYEIKLPNGNIYTCDTFAEFKDMSNYITNNAVTVATDETAKSAKNAPKKRATKKSAKNKSDKPTENTETETPKMAIRSRAVGNLIKRAEKYGYTLSEHKSGSWAWFEDVNGEVEYTSQTTGTVHHGNYTKEFKEFLELVSVKVGKRTYSKSLKLSTKDTPVYYSSKRGQLFIMDAYTEK